MLLKKKKKKKQQNKTNTHTQPNTHMKKIKQADEQAKYARVCPSGVYDWEF